MELKDFIERSLIDIAESVMAANNNLKNKTGKNKSFRLVKGYEGYLKDLQTKNPGFVDFDVAVTVKNEKNKGGKLGLQIKIVEIGGTLSKSTSSEQVSRIRFSVGMNAEIS